MLGFAHRRGRSLISVYSMVDDMRTADEVDEDEPYSFHETEARKTPRGRRNMNMIYLLFLAEAIIQASLSSQVAVLVQASDRCMGVDASFLRSIFECAYFLGSTCGLLWGRVADEIGRRRAALSGLVGMEVCCLAMGFTTSFTSIAALRFVAGATSSAVTVSGLAMLGDSLQGARRTQTVARLPLITACGSIVPIATNGLRQLSERYASGLFARFPSLSGQLVCAGLVVSIAVVEWLLLGETLPSVKSHQHDDEVHHESEKASFLNRSDASLTITIIDALDNDSAAPRPSHLSISHILGAPSILLLLASFAILSLHSSTFDTLLMHQGHAESQHGGMSIRCEWLSVAVATLKALAAVRLIRLLPSMVERVGVLTMYRKTSLAFTILYLAIPLIGLAVPALVSEPAISELVSMIAISIKAFYAGVAQVLVLLLVLAAAPDASSTGTVIGVVSIAELFKALAVGVSGMAYYVSDEHTVSAVNFASWAALAVIAAVGAGLSWRLRESPRVGTDIPERCLTWQSIFDSESDEDSGF